MTPDARALVDALAYIETTLIRHAPSERYHESIAALDLMEATIATLRAALDAHHRGLALVGDGADKCAICATLAKAREVTG